MKNDSLGSADGGVAATSVVPFVCLLGVVLLLSTITLSVKYVFQHSGVQPIELAWFRVMIGFALLCSVTLVWDRRGLLSLAGSEILLLVAVGFLGVFSYAVAAYGLMHTSVTHYALIYSLLPSSTATLSAMMGKDQMTPVKLIGIVLSLFGCVVAVSDGARPAEAAFRFGDMFVLLFTVMMSSHIVFSAGIVRRACRLRSCWPSPCASRLRRPSSRGPRSEAIWSAAAPRPRALPSGAPMRRCSSSSGSRSTWSRS